MSGNLIKDENLKLLRSVLRKEKEATKPELAEKTGLSVVTIQSLMQTMLRNGEALEGEMIQSGLGRPALTYRFHERARLALTIYMYEKNKIDTAVCQVCDLYGRSIDRIEESITEIEKESYDVMIGKMLEKYPRIKVIAMGLPVVARDGVILASDYRKLLGVDLTGHLKAKFGRVVLLENDINAAIFGYAMQEDGRWRGCIAGIYMPAKYPPGAGICLNGKILSGRNGLAGEIKFLPHALDWSSVPYEREAVEEYLLQAMKALFCFYNPDQFVLYSEIVDKNIFRKLEESCESSMEKLLIPKMEIKRELKEDFETGMIQIALQQIVENKQKRTEC